MPVRLTWEPRGVYRQYYGDVSYAERRQSLEAICGDRRFDDLRYAITDFLEVRTYEATDAASLEAAALHIGPLATNPKIIIAAVADRPDLLAAIAHFQSHGLVTVPYQVFATLAQARDWVAQASNGPRSQPLKP